MIPDPPVVHLVNPMWDAMGGSERRSIELYRTLRRHGPAKLWSEFDPVPSLAAEVPIQRIGADHPKGGVLVIIGVYFELGEWLSRAHPERVRLVVNTPNLAQTQARIQQLLAATGLTPEVVYASEELAQVVGLPGTCELSMIDLERFRPAVGRAPASRFTVGRLSRDVDFKHHPDDPALYARLAGGGFDVQIMGGTVLAGKCPPAVSLLPAGAVYAPTFLRRLDCFVYRTAPHWLEVYGRVVFEAMASGLPIVCENRGGYRAFLRPGHDSFLFDTTDEALSVCERLRSDAALRVAVGVEARRTVERLYAGYDRQLARDYFGAA